MNKSDELVQRRLTVEPGPPPAEHRVSAALRALHARRRRARLAVGAVAGVATASAAIGVPVILAGRPTDHTVLTPADSRGSATTSTGAPCPQPTPSGTSEIVAPTSTANPRPTPLPSSLTPTQSAPVTC